MTTLRGGSADISERKVHVLFAPGNLFGFSAFLDATFGTPATTTSGTTPRDLPDGSLPVTSTSTSTCQEWPCGLGKGTSAIPPLPLTSSFGGGDVLDDAR